MNKTIDLVIPPHYLSPFASPQDPRLSTELADYLTTETAYLLNIQLNIRCPEREQAQLVKAIHNTFGQKCVHLKNDMRLLRIQAVSLLLLSLLLVVSSMQLKIEGTISLGMITIVAWMMVWRSAEIVLLDLRAAKRIIRQYQRIIQAPKQFVQTPDDAPQ